MTVKLVILNNPGKEVVEMYDSKEIKLKTGENVLPATVARSLVGRIDRNYKILGVAENQDEPCPFCGQIIKGDEPKKEQPKAAGVETLPSTVQKPPESSKETQDSTSDKDPLDGVDKTTLLNLCKRQGITADQRMSEDTLRSKLRETLPTK